MKEVKLMNLTFKNFKGIKKFDLGADGQDLKAFGDNGTGKTTLFDGFVWLLFNKDSNNRADFAIKTLVSGKEINNLEHEVEAVFRIDGSPLTLRKVYAEKWTKRRGSATKEFSGHETNYFIDGVPSKKGEYQSKVDSIVKEEVFKLLTSPTFFNENLKWQERRATLLEVCGDIEEEDVLAFNSALKNLPTILRGRTIEDHRKIIAARRAEINKELDRIPVRIDEINNSLPEINIDVPSIEKEVAVIEKQLDENATQINNIKNGSAITGKQNELRQIEMDLESVKRDLESDSIQKGHEINAKIQEEQSNISILKRKKDDAEHQIKRNNETVTAIDTRLAELRDEWEQVNATEFVHESECACPTCGQDLPEGQVVTANEKALAQFNLTKSKSLEEISVTGKRRSEKKAEAVNDIEKLTTTVGVIQSQIDDKAKVVSKLEVEIETLRTAVKDARQDPKYQSKLQEQAKLNDEIKSLKDNAQESVTSVEKEVAELRIKRTELNAQIAQQAQVVASEKRIAELEEQQKELANEFEKLEGELYLTEEFIRSKVELLTEKINSKFKYARFNLFKTNINGGIEEICETTFDGVPYSSGLNNAARINVGIDIINTLTEHFGIRAPIFVDNAEAVTQLIDTDSQLISLVVSEKDKQLRIEKNELQEAI
ncbi:AAA family ATPase [Sporosarcina sp. ANT_H38]|uniref:AAA family ATPase n=1 Tax=Sporosarcina sp. ANT_H38 TaxID=2597358 RepID=UPI0011F0A54B|nr:AAA family ATPase [Sporosarcina sp. ANT_H38]KAA0941588.1 AAA family ATPase [Sporosarcina sp. ANT_H38]